MAVTELQIKTEGYKNSVKNHPCFGGEANINCGRIHLPVSPKCNISCRFCKRCFNNSEERPGVSRTLLTPQRSIQIVEKALELCPEITVVGIAGPGDTLATDHAIETFELIHTRFPHLINCLSTNGLLLEEKAERVVAAGVKTVTVTVNAIDPVILDKICSGILYKDRFISGTEAAGILINAQLTGIRKIAGLGAVVKINSVLVPGVNDENIGEIAKLTSEAGASIVNIIPLIPQGDMSEYSAPGCNELNNARDAAGEYLDVFRHCRHCRADACGIPGKGKDFSNLLYEYPAQDTFSHG